MQDPAIGPRLLPAVDLGPEVAPRTIDTDQLVKELGRRGGVLELYPHVFRHS